MIINELERLGVNLPSDGSYETKLVQIQKVLRRAIDKEITAIHQQIAELVNPLKEDKVTVRRFKEVVRLGEGFGFGELALLKTAGRAATIECTQPTKFATLNRKTYILTIGHDEKRKLKKVVDFFRTFRMFENLRASTIERIYQYMEKRKFIRGQKVFRERITVADGLYFIIKGEFEVT